MPKTKTKTKSLAVWKDEFYVQAYQLAKSGATNPVIAAALKVKPSRLNAWMREKPALAKAMLEGRKPGNYQEEYILGRLSPSAKKVWDRVCQINTDERNGILGKRNGISRMQRLFDRRGEGVRKKLFLHALVKSYFNPSQACRKLGISWNTFKKWVEDDFEFGQAVEEMQMHKANNFDGALTELALKDRDPAALIFVNKTMNRERGYGERTEVHHTGEISQKHEISISEELLERLSRPAKRELLNVIDQLQLESQEIVNGGV